MKIYKNGQAIELTAEEVEAIEQFQQEQSNLPIKSSLEEEIVNLRQENATLKKQMETTQSAVDYLLMSGVV